MPDAQGERSFSVLLRRYRRAAGLTQGQLAERAGLSERAISDLERDAQRVPRRDTIDLLARALDLSIHDKASLDQAVRQTRGQAQPVLPSTFPPPPSPQAPLHNLPRLPTALTGRKAEQQEVLALLANAQLVTLTGTGGVGKTRLALAVAAQLLDQYPDGVWLVELASLADASLVPAATSQALGILEEQGRSLLSTLTEHLREKQLLLVLDNCEHLIAACAEMVGTLFRSCPHLAVLAASREGLAVNGERRYRVPSLSVPDVRRLPSPELTGSFEAVRLFVLRAVERRADFALTEQNARTVAGICARLDGIPLAIELAAARVAGMSVEAIAERLGDRFRLLTGGPRDLPSRQRTLRATLDWSWDLLPPVERALLGRLSVFADGWTLEAAEVVCVEDGQESWVMLDALGSLVEKSLVQFDDAGGAQPRYSLLETVHHYAAERLTDTGAPSAVRDTHLAHFLALAESALPALRGSEQGRWLAYLEREHGNMRAALAWARESGAWEQGLQLAAALWWFWYSRGHYIEGRTWLRQMLAADRGAPADRARALHGAASLAHAQGENGVAEAWFKEALELRRALGDRHGIAASLHNLASIAEHRGNFTQAAALIEESLAIWRDLEDRWAISTALNSLGWLMGWIGEPARAAVYLEEALVLKREIGDRAGIAASLNHLANVAYQRDELQHAAKLYEESLAIRRALGDRGGIPDLLRGLGRIASKQGDYRRAAVLHAESLRLAQEAGAQVDVMISLELVGRATAHLGQARRAALLLSAAEALRQALGTQIPPLEAGSHERALQIVRDALTVELFTAAWNEGSVMSLPHAIALALEPPA